MSISSRLFSFGGVMLSSHLIRKSYGLVTKPLCCTNIQRCTFATLSRKYSDRHEWAVRERDNVFIIGISQYAQEALGDVVFAQLPEVNTLFKCKDECGALESVKAVSEIYSPLSGKVIEKNTSVEDNPGLVNKSCYGDGWLFKIECSNPAEIESLMTEDEYEQFLKTSAKTEH